MKTITVFVITYNQEDVIRRALDSILSQKDWGLYQILIGDDCSKDGTYDILLEYQSKYPEIVKPIRNEKNLGIYGNIQNLIQYRGSSDLYTSCSGDDAFCEGYFQSIQEYINNNNISLDKEVGLYSDWIGIDTNNKETIHRQSVVSKHYRLWGLHIRGAVSTRSLMYSKSVIDQFRPVPLDKGLRLAESLYGSQPSRIIKHVFYMPKTTSIYYTGIGVSTTLSKTGYSTTENIVKWNYYLDHLIQEKRDVFYAKHQLSMSRYLLKPNAKEFLKVLWYYLRGLYPINYSNIKTIPYLVLRLLRYAKLNK